MVESAASWSVLRLPTESPASSSEQGRSLSLKVKGTEQPWEGVCHHCIVLGKMPSKQEAE